MQLKEKPELNQINEQSEFLAKTYQPYRPLKEPKSVAKVDRTNLQPLKEPKSVAKVDRTNLQPIKEPKSVAKVDRTNLQPIKESKSVAKVDRTLQPLKEPQSVAKVDRTNLQPIKEPKSVTTTQWPDLPPLKERKFVATVDMQPKEKLELNQINQKLEVFVKNYRQDLQPIKERKSVPTVDRQDLRSIKNRKSVATTYQPYLRSIKEPESVAITLLKIIFIHFPLAMIKLFFGIIFLIIVAAIAIPDLASCGNKGRQSEGKQYVGSINRAQQAKYADNGAFYNSITALDLGIKSETTNYNYSIIATKNAAFSYGVARRNNLRSYVGAVFFVGSFSPGANNKNTTVSILCEAKSPGKTQPPDPILQNGNFACGDGTVLVSR